MQPKYAILPQADQEEISTSQEFAHLLETFLTPLLLVLDQVLDKRLVRTLVQCCVAIIRFRNHKQGLLLSELGSYLGGSVGLSQTATAGTKRVGKLIRSLKWSALHIDRFLLEEAGKEVERLKGQGKRILCLFDGSVIEKPESSKLEATGPVLSEPCQTTEPLPSGIAFYYADPATHSGDGNGLDRDHHHGTGRHSQARGHAVVDHQRGLCRKTPRERGGSAALAGAHLGAAADLCRGIAAMLLARGWKCCSAFG